MKNNNKTILVVEDDTTYQNVIALKLRKEGYTVTIANDGSEALAMLEHAPRPDLILLDLILPNKDGFEVLEDIQKDPSLRAIPVFVLTQLGQDSDKKKALSYGAREYLIKTDVSIFDMVALVEKYLERSVKTSKNRKA